MTFSVPTTFYCPATGRIGFGLPDPGDGGQVDDPLHSSAAPHDLGMIQDVPVLRVA